MKIGVLSDVHIDRNKDALKSGETFEEILSNLLLEKEVELLMLAGDVSNHFETSQEFIEKVQVMSGVPIVFVPGNHDYWAKDHEVTDTNEIHQFFKQQSESLIENPRMIGDNWAIVGSPGWYDYGYGNQDVYSLEAFEKKQYKFASWNDRHYVNWGKSDKEISSDMLKQIRNDLKKVKGRKILLMTHIATHPEFVVPLPHRVYDYANAFLGAKSYETLYEDFPSIKYSIMGHVHFRKSYFEKDRRFLTACLGNKKHWRVKDVKKQLERTLVTIEL